MTATFAPFGLRPVRHFMGGKTMAPQMIRLTKALAEATPSMGRGTPVTFDASGRLAVAANAADWIGCFLGVEYIDLASGRPVRNNRWVNGSTVEAHGNDAARFYFTRDPYIVYEIQADATLAIANLAEEVGFTVASIAAFDALTGLSTASIDAASVDPAQDMMRIVNIGQRIDNDWGDAFPIMEVMIARHVEAGIKAGI